VLSGVGEAIITYLLHTGFAGLTGLHLVFISIGLLFIYLGIAKRIEPLLLIGIGSGMVLANIPFGYVAGPPPSENLPTGILWFFYKYLLVKSPIVPILIFFGLGALTDFRPLIAQPYTFILGAAAQLGVFVAMYGALLMGFDLNVSAAIGVIGGAEGPTTLYTAARIAPYYLGPIGLACYSYMALVPIIQPPLIRLVPKKHRMVRMEPPRMPTQLEVILFPILLLTIGTLVAPNAAALIGMFAFGNILRESGVTEVVERLARTAGNQLMDVLIIVLTVTIGSTMSVDMIHYYVGYMQQLGFSITFSEYLIDAVKIYLWGMLAFAFGTLGGLGFGELLYYLTGGKVNPVIGSAGVSAVPMAARVSQKEAQRLDPQNIIIMNAMGPNLAGAVGAAIVAGVYIGFVEHFYAAYQAGLLAH
jgi:sodium ion-translocating decarboxylase beta subunit